MEHIIEQRVNVYLRWDDEQREWYIEPESADVGPLSGYDGGPDDDECCDHDGEGHSRAYSRAAEAGLPNLRELHEMIGVFLEVEEIKHHHVHIMKPGHPRNLSGGLRVDLRRILSHTFGCDVRAPRVDDAIANLTPLLQSVDENAYQRGRAGL